MSVEIASSVCIGEITNLDGLESIRAEWFDLWKKADATTPFQSPEWLIAWWKYFGSGELLVLVFRAEDSLVAIAPFYLRPENGMRKLLLIGTGISDYLDVIAIPEFANLVGKTLAQYLSGSNLWQSIDFQELRPESLLLKLEICNLSADAISVQEVCPRLALPRNVDQLAQFIPANQLQNIQYYRRRAKKIGAIQIESITEENFDELFSGLIRFHTAHSQSQKTPGAFAAENVQQFHRQVARKFFSSGGLRLFGLRVEGQLAAVFYGFKHHECTFYYLGGFDPQFARTSPGTLLIAHAIENAIGESVDEFDFLRGAESYKYLWGAKDQVNYRRFITRNISP